MAIGLLELIWGDRLLDSKLLVAFIRFIPADIDNSLLLVGVCVERLALERVAFQLVWSHLVVGCPLLLRCGVPRVESGCGEQRFLILHLRACAARKASHNSDCQ